MKFITNKLDAKIQNVITTGDLGQYTDATKFISYSWGTYDMNFYGGLCGYVKDKSFQGRVTVFLTGKMISTGTNSVRKSIIQLERAKNILVENGIIKRVKLIPKVQNIVSSLDLGMRIRLDELVTYTRTVTYNPDRFPGAVLRVRGSLVCLLFASGKIVITGSKKESDTSYAITTLKKTVKPFCYKD